MINLQQLIDREKITQSELARKLELSSHAVCRWCNGGRKMPSDMAARIAKMFTMRAVVQSDGTFLFERVQKRRKVAVEA